MAVPADERFAVLDLGSNSFRLLVARREGGQVRIVDRVKERVQLLRDFNDGRLHPVAIARALDCLRRYAQRLTSLPRAHIAMIGTHPLREGANRAELVGPAEAIMGTRLRVVSGEEEAALVYRGVLIREPPVDGLGRLVIDIGGGSTELALGGARGPGRLRSCRFGCVALADRFFRAAAPLESAFVAARQHLEKHLPDFDTVADGTEVIGTSGTIESVQAVLTANGWSDREISAGGLELLVRELQAGRWDPESGMLGLAPDRVDIFPAGVALLSTLFQKLRIRSMRYVGAALEDGVLDGLLGGAVDPLAVRQQTVVGLQARYGIDRGQASRVRRTAVALFDQADGWWPPGARTIPGRDWRQLLAWSAELHELGLAVSPRAHHRHGAYLLRHADIRGFSPAERELLALLVRGHRRGLPLLAFNALADAERRHVIRLAALLRIAVILERSQSDAESPKVRMTVTADAQGDGILLDLPADWLAAHPLSRRELEFEPLQLAPAGIRLAFGAPP